MTQEVWFIDDDQSIRWVLEKACVRAKLSYRSFSGAEAALKSLETHVPAVVLTDVRMNGLSGFDFLAEAKKKNPNLPIIVMTAYSDLETTVQAFQGGAFDYVSKPFDIHEVIELIQRALNAQQTPVMTALGDLLIAQEILGQSPAMQAVFKAIGRLSQTHATVLITGESGTGKELVARALHRHSLRQHKPFVAINTAAIPKELLESELFGHEKGSFTGSVGQRLGRFEQAEGGTLFLDEIGDMPFELQTRLLRVLSDGHFYRVGGQTPILSRARIIAATHQNLEKRVQDGLFREDLFHRLNVIRIPLPSLRQRPQDIALLVHHFMNQGAALLQVEPKRVAPATLTYLESLPWPGNIRQLENLCQWLTVMVSGAVVELSDLPSSLNAEVGSVTESLLWTDLLAQHLEYLFKSGRSDVIESLTKQYETILIQQALKMTEGRRMEAAQWLGWGRNTLTRKMQELNLEQDNQTRK
jgi:two-component system nitrogen regulation response regulator GlnG